MQALYFQDRRFFHAEKVAQRNTTAVIPEYIHE
jgi:hypothetical protein